MVTCNYIKHVEKWDIFEITCYGKQDKNPFIDYQIKGIFQGKNECVEIDGVYDGEGRYIVRFMPSFEGKYEFSIQGNFSDEVYQGEFYVTSPQKENHEPVRVANTYHFAYEDGTPYYPIGTTCYVWTWQCDERIVETLSSLKEAGFNKIRFCIFPKHYDYNLGEPRSYPYEGIPMNSAVLTKDNFSKYIGNVPGNHWDFTRFCTEHFQHLEKCIQQLLILGIEADLILMHPYDRWGFSYMSREQDLLYWNYVIARLSAYRNVWWSLANEYDLMEDKTIEDWEACATLLCEKDVYHHLRSIHNCHTLYDFTRPWVTHCSIQRTDIYKTAEMVNEWRERYRKPVVLDEIVYEGNLQHAWGNISGQEMTRRFWEGAMRGGYPGHGETYLNDKDVIWWSHGGKLYGESWKRVKFLKTILYETPGIGLKYKNLDYGTVCAVPEDVVLENKNLYFLFYYSFMQPAFKEFYFDDVSEYQVEVLDTWEMTIEKRGIFNGKFRIDLPGKPYMAIRIRKTENLQKSNSKKTCE